MLLSSDTHYSSQVANSLEVYETQRITELPNEICKMNTYNLMLILNMVGDLQNLSFELHEPQDRKICMIPGNMIPKFPIPNIHYEDNGV